MLVLFVTYDKNAHTLVTISEDTFLIKGVSFKYNSSKSTMPSPKKTYLLSSSLNCSKIAA